MIKSLMRGLIDGALSTLGVVIGAISAPNAMIIISAAFSGAVANGFSNILAAFSAERTAGYQKIQELEEKMFTRLKGTRQEKFMHSRVMKRGILDGISTVAGGAIPIIPLLFLSGLEAMYMSIASVVLLMGIMGAYTGTLARENLIFSGAKMAFFATLTAAVCIFIEIMI